MGLLLVLSAHSVLWLQLLSNGALILDTTICLWSVHLFFLLIKTVPSNTTGIDEKKYIWNNKSGHEEGISSFIPFFTLFTKVTAITPHCFQILYKELLNTKKKSSYQLHDCIFIRNCPSLAVMKLFNNYGKRWFTLARTFGPCCPWSYPYTWLWPNTSILRTKCSLAVQYIPSTNRCHDGVWHNVIHSTCQWS